ncbi:MAG: hypothetical protein C4562_07320, partial [Actinobacteria bacterium]
MKNKTKIFIVILISGILLVGLAFFVYFYSSLTIFPKNTIITNQTKPKIVADWTYALGANLKEANVYVDGRDVTNQIKLTARGFIYIPAKPLADGLHHVQAKLKYDFIYNKSVNTKWVFATDTIAPKITIGQGVKVLASQTNSLKVSGVTEPGSKLNLYLNKKKLDMVTSDDDGQFKLALSQLKKKNFLEIRAFDVAGNKTVIKLPVLIDNLPPNVAFLTPAPGSTVFGKNTGFKFKLKDNSAINSMKLFIDDKEVSLNHTLGKND